MAPPPARVFTIPASAPFIPTLIEALRDGRLIPGFPATQDPLALARATLYLPTRRAGRLARDLFLDVTGGSAAILPRIVALGDLDEDEIAFAQAAAGGIGATALDLRDSVGGLERRLLLAQLIAQWAATPGVRGEAGAPLIAANPATVLALADDLAHLMDDMITRQVPWDRLDDLVPDHLDEYWQLTVKFLKIAREAWPNILAERDAMEPAARRDALIKAETERLAASDGPVIAAGSTGSMPATAELMAAIARLPHGAVVLPGLDTDLDEKSWQTIAGTGDDGDGAVEPAIGHPQFAMQTLLQRIGIARSEVVALAAPADYGRERLVSEALRPAATTEHWRERLASPDFSAHADKALNSLCVIEAANAEEEALAIAVALREAVEQRKSAALVTPDRALARRVAAQLTRWQVAVEDSGGDGLPDTPAGLFARLAADAALGGLAPVDLLALLKHPLARLGDAEGAHASATATLEQAVLRGPRPRPGTGGLAHALASFRIELDKLRHNGSSELHRSEPRARLADAPLNAASALVKRLTAALAPLENLGTAARPLTDLAARHRAVLTALSADAGTPAAFGGVDGVALASAFDDIALAAGQVALAPADYAEFFHVMIADKVARRPVAPGVQVHIYGLLEARLQNIQRLVLGGLVEGAWPPETRTDPWLSRPMRQQLGLDLPERRISLSAHDFAQSLGAPEVILTRAAKSGGAPTVASRFMQRLAAVAGARWDNARARGENYLHWARALDASPEPPRPAKRPQPMPPVAARPSQLSVTEIEHWLRDPYTIYAKHILRLTPLDPVDTPPGARDRGTVIHRTIGEFTEQFANGLPPDPLEELIALGRRHFAALDDYPEARAFWWPRFQRIARWFAAWEKERRADVAALHVEAGAKLEIPLGTRSFTLSTRADRIERLADGRYALLDYKTGQARSARQVASGLAPQLTLEGAILRAGKFRDIPQGSSIAQLLYVLIKGGDPAGEAKPIAWKDSTPDAEADKALAALTRVAKKFEEETTPYRSRERPMWQRRAYGEYDHLARVKEWSLSGGAGDDSDDSGGGA
jgi:ATP-dependent helicase/nuclease subunit B